MPSPMASLASCLLQLFGRAAEAATRCRCRATAGLRIWNYNKSLEDTTRGLKAVQLLLDGKPISPPGETPPWGLATSVASCAQT